MRNTTYNTNTKQTIVRQRTKTRTRIHNNNN